MQSASLSHPSVLSRLEALTVHALHRTCRCDNLQLLGLASTMSHLGTPLFLSFLPGFQVQSWNMWRRLIAQTFMCVSECECMIHSRDWSENPSFACVTVCVSSVDSVILWTLRCNSPKRRSCQCLTRKYIFTT
jgi:hypothetical protein